MLEHLFLALEDRLLGADEPSSSIFSVTPMRLSTSGVKVPQLDYQLAGLQLLFLLRLLNFRHRALVSFYVSVEQSDYSQEQTIPLPQMSELRYSFAFS